MNVLVIGWNPPLVSDLSEDPDLSVHVLEEPSLLHEVPSGVPAIAARYQQDDAYRATVPALHAEHAYDVILPGREYGVPAAQWLSDRLGLPSVGDLATRASVDKSFLRRTLADSGLPHVRSAVVTGREEVEDFFDGRPIVLKPANRHASIGVVRIEHAERIPAAWAAATSPDEGKATIDRDLDWTYIAEDWVPGEEFSVESVFSPTGETFHNITEKTVIGGGRFTPLRHVAPAPLDADARARLLAAQEDLARVLGVKRGLIHAEWKQDGERCWIIELSVRYPGGRIPLIVRNATGVNLARAWVDSLLGRSEGAARSVEGAAGVAFVRHPPGRFVRIDGLPEPGTDTAPGVIASGWSAEPGELLRPLDDAAARKGFVAVRGADYAEVAGLLDRYTDAVDVLVEDDAEPDTEPDTEPDADELAGHAGPARGK